MMANRAQTVFAADSQSLDATQMGAKDLHSLKADDLAGASVVLVNTVQSHSLKLG